MSIALFSAAKLFAAHPALPLTSLLAWFWRARTAPAAVTIQKPNHTVARPRLRVWSHTDGSQSGSSSTRFVISGRMSEVCAELDRLAALEARLH